MTAPLMTEESLRNKVSRTKRREAFWRRASLFVGCGAATLLIASLVFIVSQRLMQGPEKFADEEYLRSRYGLAQGEGGWSKQLESAPALFGARKKELEEVASRAPRASAEGEGTPLVRLTPRVSGIENLEQKREKISGVLRAFFAASTEESRLAFVRDAQRVQPLMTLFYQREPIVPHRLRELGYLVKVDEPGYRFAYAEALFEDATPASLVVEEQEDGRILIDWECLVRYGELGWADFQRLKPVNPTLMRLIASRPEVPPYQTTAARGEWLELRHPAESGTILGWFDKADPRFAGLLEQLQSGEWKDVPVTLRLCFPQSPSLVPGGVAEIAGVEGKGWLMIEGHRTNG